jgi:hypothetical protein
MKDSCQFQIGGPKTFRLGSRAIMKKSRQLSSGEWKERGLGGNLQNIEKSMREIYIPDGWTSALKDKCSYYMASGDLSVFTDEELSKLNIFVQTDQSGAEALAVAYLCKDGDFRQLFIHGVKPHVYVALHVFKDVWKKKMREAHISGDVRCDIDEILNTPICDFKSNPYWKDLDRLIKDSDNWSLDQRYYYLAKQTCHSANYGITANPFRMNILEKSGGKIVISMEDADHFIETYHALFPEIRDWHRRLRQQVEMTKMMYNLHGHPYMVTSHEIQESSWKELFAWIPQSSIGMITNIAYANLQQYIESERLNWDNLVNCHDSILSQCPIGQEKLLGQKQQEFIEQSFVSPVDEAPFRMRSETQYGFNWSPFKAPDKNKCGLREMKLP